MVRYEKFFLLQELQQKEKIGHFVGGKDLARVYFPFAFLVSILGRAAMTGNPRSCSTSSAL